MKTQTPKMLNNGQPFLKRNPEILSPRELEIIDIITEGLNTEGFNDEQVAARLSIAVSTVRTHIRRIHQKLQAEDYR